MERNGTFIGEPEAVAALQAAWARVLVTVTNPTKDRTAKIEHRSGASHSYTYANLATVAEAIRKALGSEGIAVIQFGSTDMDAGAVGMQTTIAGHGASFTTPVMWLPADGNNTAHATGSAMTYLRRYQLTALFMLAPDDDDDGAAVGGARYRQRQAPPQRQQSAPRQQQPSQHAADLQALYGILQGAGFDGGTRDGLAVTNLALGSLVAGTTIERCQGSASTTRRMLEALRGSDLATLRRQAEADHAVEDAS